MTDEIDDKSKNEQTRTNGVEPVLQTFHSLSLHENKRLIKKLTKHVRRDRRNRRNRETRMKQTKTDFLRIFYPFLEFSMKMND